jgi:hypothetical protein
MHVCSAWACKSYNAASPPVLRMRRWLVASLSSSMDDSLSAALPQELVTRVCGHWRLPGANPCKTYMRAHRGTNFERFNTTTA